MIEVKSAPRMIRVNELIKREVADSIEKHIEHKKDCLISVTEVNTTPDLRQAKVRISILGNDDAKKDIMRTLQKKRTFIQQLLARNIALKYTPVIEFQYDSRIELGDKVLAMLNELENE
jgi:ribosome-binding factor A